MCQLKEYIKEVLGVDVQVENLTKQYFADLPLYISEVYFIHKLVLFDHHLIVVEPKDLDSIRIRIVSKHLAMLRKYFGEPVVLQLQTCTSIQRKRLIEKGINFIVPGKQFFLPELLIDLREDFVHPRAMAKKERLRPSAQFLIIFHLLHSTSRLSLAEYSLNKVAVMMGYTPMAISMAVDNLKGLELIDVLGSKEKYISFRLDKKELWEEVNKRSLFVNPVLKSVFVDKKPDGISLLHSNVSALSHYSNMSHGVQKFFAIDKSDYYTLNTMNALINQNSSEGEYCLEVWKYNPRRILGEFPENDKAVDKLSLFLSMKSMKDERVEMALEQMVNEFRWFKQSLSNFAG